jgi:hypothetical protein
MIRFKIFTDSISTLAVKSFDELVTSLIDLDVKAFSNCLESTIRTSEIFCKTFFLIIGKINDWNIKEQIKLNNYRNQ